jgi:lipoprotein-anchoring transpeptidase ErfK/SrfK
MAPKRTKRIAEGIVGLTLLAVSGLAVSPVGGALAQAPAASMPKDMLQIDEQPGYVPPAEAERLGGSLERQVVFFRTNEAAGTVVVHTNERFLYVVAGNNRALRYGIGVGRDGFQWSGLVKVVRKQEWPDWRPPDEMIERQPYLPRFMAGGPGNPMGARALYLGGTVYRIHGTNQPDTIGHAVSSGCFRLVNQDVIDLYDRIPVGTKVIVKHAASL